MYLKACIDAEALKRVLLKTLICDAEEYQVIKVKLSYTSGQLINCLLRNYHKEDKALFQSWDEKLSLVVGNHL